ncbi:hypothetical protein EZV62_002461 [Acer yangbiense]|uniref:Factor of DNA methylation 1-5/IDN2 domain-containing protein n=1 Tax=Acer yangbiense TaxID=1000413 RepID=A0A5C7IZ45_9ROSI|nr:hypothetical protein EZV62_002461 [Acer yangbiense]
MEKEKELRMFMKQSLECSNKKEKELKRAGKLDELLEGDGKLDNALTPRKVLIDILSLTLVLTHDHIGVSSMRQLDLTFGTRSLTLQWQENFRNLAWHPFKIIDDEGNNKEVIDADDEQLKNLKNKHGEEVYRALTVDLNELNEYNTTTPPIGLWYKNYGTLVMENSLMEKEKELRMFMKQSLECSNKKEKELERVGKLDELLEGDGKLDNALTPRKVLIDILSLTLVLTHDHIGVSSMRQLDLTFGTQSLTLQWQENLRNLAWHPFKIIDDEGNNKEVIDADDEQLKNLKNKHGEEVYRALTVDLNELNEYNTTTPPIGFEDYIQVMENSLMEKEKELRMFMKQSLECSNKKEKELERVGKLDELLEGDGKLDNALTPRKVLIDIVSLTLVLTHDHIMVSSMRQLDLTFGTRSLTLQWQENLRNLAWHPFKIIDDEGNNKKVMDANDEQLKNLKNKHGEEVYRALTVALNELNEYNPTDRSMVQELWNFEVIDANDEQLKNLKNKHGEEVYRALTVALNELNEYNPTDRSMVQ